MAPDRGIAGPPYTKRAASVDIEQLPNGYWRGEVMIQVPGYPPNLFVGESFHDAGEALDWARLTIETTVAHAS